MRKPGTGAVAAYGYLAGDSASGSAGVGLDIETRLRNQLGLFATGRAGTAWGARATGLTYEALFGLRGSW